jgi:hypothetical protein
MVGFYNFLSSLHSIDIIFKMGSKVEISHVIILDGQPSVLKLDHRHHVIKNKFIFTTYAMIFD